MKFSVVSDLFLESFTTLIYNSTARKECQQIFKKFCGNFCSGLGREVWP